MSQSPMRPIKRPRALGWSGRGWRRQWKGCAVSRGSGPGIKRSGQPYKSGQWASPRSSVDQQVNNKWDVYSTEELCT